MELASLPAETRACIDYAIRAFANRCISHPLLDADPTPVIAAERDKMLDELANMAAPKKPAAEWQEKKPSVWTEKVKTNGRART